MDISTLKKILPTGDLADRLMINKIKIHNIPEKADIISEESKILQEIFDVLTSDCDQVLLSTYMQSLYEVLQKQWDALDGVRDPLLTIAEIGGMAILAQDLNVERVMWKNMINSLSNSFIEYKKYGKN